MTNYARECTIRGLVDVSHDIHILPGDRLRFDKNTDGSYSIVVLKGELWLQRFTNLIEINGNDPVIDPLPVLDSVSISDVNAYYQAIRAFKNNTVLKSVRRLQEEQKYGNDTLTINIVTPKAKDGREIMILDIRHAVAQLAENGTGHGDWT